MNKKIEVFVVVCLIPTLWVPLPLPRKGVPAKRQKLCYEKIEIMKDGKR